MSDTTTTTERTETYSPVGFANLIAALIGVVTDAYAAPEDAGRAEYAAVTDADWDAEATRPLREPHTWDFTGMDCSPRFDLVKSGECSAVIVTHDRDYQPGDIFRVAEPGPDTDPYDFQLRRPKAGDLRTEARITHVYPAVLSGDRIGAGRVMLSLADLTDTWAITEDDLA